MSMQKITIEEVKKIAKQYKLFPCRLPRTDGIQIRKYKNIELKDISWEDFEKILRKRKLAVYRAENSDFLKIMKDK